MKTAQKLFDKYELQLKAIEEKNNELKNRLNQLIVSSKFHHSNTTDRAKSMYYFGMTAAYEGILKFIESLTKEV